MTTEVELELNTEDSQRVVRGTGRIRILLCVPEADVAAVATIAAARKDASTVSTGTAATVAEHMDAAQTAILSQNSTFGALGTVLSKIDVFVKIVDQTASVRG
jgi:hypothetical protein